MQTMSLVWGMFAFSVMMAGFLPVVGWPVTFAAIVLCAGGAVMSAVALRMPGPRGNGPAIAGLTANGIGLVTAVLRVFYPGTL